MLALLLLLCTGASAAAFDKPASGTTVLTLTVPSPDDTEAPAVTITVGLNSWQSFLREISFGLLFSEEQRVTVSAQDESGIASLCYLTRTSALTTESIRDEALTWTPIENGGYFTVSPYARLIVYVKATDAKGNTGYYCSDGFIVQRCRTDGNTVIVEMDNSQLPAQTSGYIAAYDAAGRMLAVVPGTAVADTGWSFPRSITQKGSTWKCFFVDSSNRPVRDAVELRELSSLQ